MPATNMQFMPRSELLTFEELRRVAELLVARCGVDDIRITGGEPLVRRDLDRLIAQLASIRGLRDLSLTTNGVLLADQAERLKRAGVRRLNISLDTLDRQTFKTLTRRDLLSQTLAGIDAAVELGFESIKLNALAIQGVTEREAIPLIEFATRRGIQVRFIEFMPLDGDRAWNVARLLSGDTLLEIIEQHYGGVQVVPRENRSQPAEAFRLSSGVEVGIIRSVTQPFCGNCNRLRVTADGSIRNCLFAREEVSIRDLIRAGASDEELCQLIKDCVFQKKASHGIDSGTFLPPNRTMHAIGG